MSELDQETTIRSLARETLTELAPHELVSFRVISDAFFSAPSRFLEKNAPRDEILGFGGGEILEILSGPALVLSTIAVSRVFDASFDVLKEGMKASVTELARTWVKSRTMFNDRNVTAAIATHERITATQLRDIRPLLVETALHLELSEASADRLADAIICKLLERLG